MTKETTFSPGPLDSATTCFWRVDETVAMGPARPGPVWSFATYLPVDDFESYTDETGSRIYEGWIDGYADQSSGSTVGHIEAPFAEQNIVHGGMQSMPLDYNNIHSPFYSEAEHPFDTPQDWTANDVNSLVISVRGRATNGAAAVYVMIQDSSNRTATIVHPDPGHRATGEMDRVADPAEPVRRRRSESDASERNGHRRGRQGRRETRAAGLIYVDDIRLIKAIP